MNEAIVAMWAYYYDDENVTKSKLSFRRGVDEPDDCADMEDEENMAEFALRNDGPLNQPLGEVITKEGRCIAFPNHIQHCVSSFSLLDKTKPGHRKMLFFYLVNPEYNDVPDSSLIPPQQ
ncbi:hypothetical protein BT69DRAFT_1340962 [Atractiella rhizophila]|nr:hypothetical protein BT69DRAFT_1340962 [Atractiella rhizophila]